MFVPIIRAHIQFPSSFAIIGHFIVRELYKKNIDHDLLLISKDSGPFDRSEYEYLLGKQVTEEYVKGVARDRTMLSITTIPYVRPKPSYQLLYTDWEATKIPSFYRKSTDDVDIILVPSEFAKKAFELGKSNTPIRVVPHGIDPDIFHIQPEPTGKFTFLTIAADDWRKGLDVLEKAFRQEFKVSEANLLVRSSRDFTKAKNIIKDTTKIPFSRMGDMYAGVHAFVLPTRGEGFCLLPETPVVTEDGITPMIDIQRGTGVYTHKGRFRPVTSVLSRYVFEEPIYSVDIWGYPFDISMTGEHPVLVIKRNGARPNWDVDDATWIKCRHLEKGDCVLFPSYELENKEYRIDYVSIDDSVLYDDSQVWFKNGYSPRVMSSISNIMSITGETKKVVETTIHKYHSGVPPSTPRQEVVYEYLKSINHQQSKPIRYRRFYLIDENMSRLLGYYASEGSIVSNGNATQFTFGKEPELVEDVKNLVGSIFGKSVCVNDYDTKTQVTLSGRVYAKLFSHLCGEGAYHKRVPNEIIQNKDLGMQFIEAAFLGDGSLSGNTWRYSSVSVDLIHGLRICLSNNGYPSTIQCSERKDRYQYTLSYSTKRGRRHSNKVVNNGGFNVHLVKDVKRTYYSGKVYNLEVEEDNTYVTGGFCVHNCLPSLEALASGLPVIITDGSGHVEFLQKDYFPIEVEGPAFRPAHEGEYHTIEYLEPSPKSCMEQMRYVYDNWEYARKIAIRGAQRCRSTYTWTHTLDKIMELWNIEG